MASDQRIMANVADRKLCERCGCVKPVCEFRRRSRSGSARLKECRACHNQAERLRRANRGTLRERRRMAKCLTALKNARSDAQLRFLCSVMLRRFGGMRGFVAAWDRYRQHAAKVGGFAEFRVIDSYLRLLEFCERHPPDLERMTDDELQRALSDRIKRLIQQQPELAVAAASEIGWKVVPDDPTD